ncbi:DUF3306 domain-containing protein [Roseicyclus sp.]|uniref:DUF3306 domain-containing protein n=1 Tax=Roseicyclus sp. TaxID=1914329 RepID=UPI001BCD4A43|nr:DUF3306 domain-containing protein [Roseicyclus sp.]
MSDATSEGFLGRWSRAKRNAAKSQPEPEVTPEPPVETSAEPAPAPEPELLSQEELDALPRIEDLTEGSDIRTFLRAGVPRQLRNAAMRRMWMLTPGIRDYSDPAVDYAWDWNTPGGVPGDGIGPSPENAAKMLKQLFKPQDDDADETAPQKDSATPQVTSAPPDAEEQASPASEADAAAAHEIAQTAPDDPSPAPDTAPRRRHGSALPG